MSHPRHAVDHVELRASRRPAARNVHEQAFGRGSTDSAGRGGGRSR